MRIAIITGLPGSGKTTLARRLAQRYGVPLLGKDLIKEPLLDSVGAPDRAQSRLLSDASFFVLFAIARELVTAEVDLILEGNFRPGEHEQELRIMLAARKRPASGSVLQILCRAREAVRVDRLANRHRNPARHPGHADAALAARGERQGDAFLEIAGERIVFESDADLNRQIGVIETIDLWWHRPRTATESLMHRISSPDTHSIDELYGLEPVYEPDRIRFAAEEFVSIRCPWCGERLEIHVDLTAGPRTYIEDCQVCCQPMELGIELTETGALHAVKVARID